MLGKLWLFHFSERPAKFSASLHAKMNLRMSSSSREEAIQPETVNLRYLS